MTLEIKLPPHSNSDISFLTAKSKMVANMQSLSSQDRCPSKEILTRSTDGHANSPKHCYGAFKAQTQFFFSPEEQHF